MDVFALGVILSDFVQGRHPFTNERSYFEDMAHSDCLNFEHHVSRQVSTPSLLAR